MEQKFLRIDDALHRFQSALEVDHSSFTTGKHVAHQLLFVPFQNYRLDLGRVQADLSNRDPAPASAAQ